MMPTTAPAPTPAAEVLAQVAMLAGDAPRRKTAMARIPDEVIERLKQEVSVNPGGSEGIKLRRHGQDLIGLCVFHDDHQPSLVVCPKTNLWNCLGACRKGGS